MKLFLYRLRGDDKHRWRDLRGESFYQAWDKTWGIPALPDQKAETNNNNEVSRNLSTTIKNPIIYTTNARVPGDGFLFQSPDTLTREGLKPFSQNPLNPLSGPPPIQKNKIAEVFNFPSAPPNYDKLLQSSQMTEVV